MKKLFVLVLLFLLMIFSLNIYDWHNLSFDELTTLAKEKSDANAQYQLGLIYHKGEMIK